MDFPAIFYKYSPFETAKKILENSSLRWSHPSIFNDAAEFQRMPIFEPSIEEVRLTHLPEFLVRVIFDDHPVEWDRLTDPSKFLLSVVKTLADQGRGRDEIRNLMSIPEEGGDERFESTMRDVFGERLVKSARVLCLAVEHDNPVMWGVYADSSKGCVLGFKHIESLSTPLLAAQPVSYVETPPVVGSALDFLLYGNPNEYSGRTIKAVCYSKHISWANEKEWRVVNFKEGGEGEYSDYKFYAEELDSVTFGTEVKSEGELLLKEIIRDKYPHAEIYKMRMKNGRLSRELV
jgi:hypothetical protein